MQQVNVPLSGLPITLACLSNGCVAFLKRAEFPTIYENPSEGNVACDFSSESFTLYLEEQEETYDYAVMHEYKHIPLMLKWLQQQQLISPF